jgi:alpha-tubulin suppressor-like RCC1 family protein
MPLGPAEQECVRALVAATDGLLAREAGPPPVPVVPPAMAVTPPAAVPPAMAVTPPAAVPPAMAVAPPAAVPPPAAAAAPMAAPAPVRLGIMTFGENEKGALGQGFQRPPNWEPAREVAMPPGAELVAVVAGSALSGFLMRDGTLLLAGSNAGYLYADTQARGRDVPTALPILGGRRVSRVFLQGSSTHMFACIDGRLHAWGRFSAGLGLDRRAITTEPTPVERLGPMQHPGGVPEQLLYDVAVGAGHTLLLLASGEVFASGNNSRGQLGIGARNNPIEIGTFERPEGSERLRFSGAACGLLHSALVATDGTLWVMGQNEYGQLGLSGKEDRFRLTRVERGSVVGARVVGVACGGETTYCITDDGRVHATGSNRFGQLGLGAVAGSEELVAVPLPGNRPARQIAAGERHALCLCHDGTLLAWGENSMCQANASAKGDSVREPRVVELGAGRSVLGMAVGRAHNVAVVGIAAGG